MGGRPKEPETPKLGRLQQLEGKVNLSETRGFWEERLSDMQPLKLRINHSPVEELPEYGYVKLEIPQEVVDFIDHRATGYLASDALMVFMAMFLARKSGKPQFDVGLSDPAQRSCRAEDDHCSEQVPVEFNFSMANTLDGALRHGFDRLAEARRNKTFTEETLHKCPGHETQDPGDFTLPITFRTGYSLGDEISAMGSELTLIMNGSARYCHWVFNQADYSVDEIFALHSDFVDMLQETASSPDRQVRELLAS